MAGLARSLGLQLPGGVTVTDPPRHRRALRRPGGPVAGRATVFVFPDLDTGSATHKAVQRSAQVVSIGPMLQGLAKPVNDLSRGALAEDIIYTIALTAVQARARQRTPSQAVAGATWPGAAYPVWRIDQARHTAAGRRVMPGSHRPSGTRHSSCVP